MKRGFTLIEMMVAVSIFVIVAFVATSAFLNLTEAYRKSQNIRSVVENLNFAIDLMSFKLREGRDYRCGDLQGNTDGGCNPARAVSFVDNNGIATQYVFVPADLSSGKKGHISTCIINTNTENCSELTSSQNININTDISGFYISTAADGQSRVIILIDGVAGNRQSSRFTVQTTVSKRN